MSVVTQTIYFTCTAINAAGSSAIKAITVASATALIAADLDSYAHFSFDFASGGAVIQTSVGVPSSSGKTITLIGQDDDNYPVFDSDTDYLSLMGADLNLKEGCISVWVWCNTRNKWQEVSSYIPD